MDLTKLKVKKKYNKNASQQIIKMLNATPESQVEHLDSTLIYFGLEHSFESYNDCWKYVNEEADTFEELPIAVNNVMDVLKPKMAVWTYQSAKAASVPEDIAKDVVKDDTESTDTSSD